MRDALQGGAPLARRPTGYLTLSGRSQVHEPLSLLLMTEAHLHPCLHSNINKASWKGAR